MVVVFIHLRLATLNNSSRNAAMGLDGADFGKSMNRTLKIYGGNSSSSTARNAAVAPNFGHAHDGAGASVALVSDATRVRISGTERGSNADAMPPKPDGQNENTASNNTASNETPYQPRLIIHIGPSKTGTTTIQMESIKLQNDGILGQDGFIYWGRYQKVTMYKQKSMMGLATLFDGAAWREYQKKKKKSSKKIDELKELLDHLKRNHKSIIISDEALSYKQSYDHTFLQKNYFENLSEILDGWNVTVVGGYRRLAEWMLSAVKERHAKIAIYGDVITAAAKNKNKNKRGVSTTSMLWPNEGGIGLRLPWDLIHSWMFDPQFKRIAGPGTTAVFYKYIDYTLTVWKYAHYRTAILNLHSSSSSSLMASLYCDIIGDVPHICKHLEENDSNERYNTKSMAWFAYNHLLFDAAKDGLLRSNGPIALRNMTRIEATDWFEHYFEVELGKSYTDLPLLCPPDEQLERLLNRSLAMEEELLPALEQNASVQQHRSSFYHSAYEKREYCWVRTKLVLRQLKSWDELVQRLKQSNASTWPVDYMRKVAG